MQFLMELWVPALISGVACTAVAAISWLVLPFHQKSWKRLPAEPAVLDAMRGSMAPRPGQYPLPYSIGQDLNRPDMRAALEHGPVGYLFITRNGPPSTALNLVLMFLFFTATSVLTAWISWHAFIPQIGTAHQPYNLPFAHIAKTVGAISAMAYGFGAFQQSVWFGRPWSSFFLQIVDALMYAAVTAFVFGWLWPK